VDEVPYRAVSGYDAALRASGMSEPRPGFAQVEVRGDSALMTVVWRTGGVAGGQESTKRPLRSRFDAVVVQSREFDVPGKDSLGKAQAELADSVRVAAVVPDADFRQRPVPR